MRQMILLSLILCVTATIRGQVAGSSSANSQCVLAVAQSPEIRGIRLEMSAEKLMAAFPEELNRTAIDKAIKDSKKPENYGLGRTDLRPAIGVANPKFVDVNWISVDLLDERVTSFTIGYVNPAWSSVDQFITKLSETLQLPAPEKWGGEPGSPNKFLKCDGFGVSALANPGTYGGMVSVRDALASQTVANRREAEKEKARKAFKP
jgi:hypothetical protein